ncbi:MAG TPA: hypothetical protein VJ276_23725 [Thermoanaerobaculia bacterium]|nr:hypothetical protein [Thermoanaerobaculia bacterium]
MASRSSAGAAPAASRWTTGTSGRFARNAMHAAIYWLGEADDSHEILDAIASVEDAATEPQLSLF